MASALALISLVVSIVTLYVAHLRGAAIALARQSPSYHIHGVIRDVGPGIAKVVTKLLLANTGNRAGILFSVEANASDPIIVNVRLDPDPATALPKVLASGEAFSATLDIHIRVNQDSLDHIAALHDRAPLQVTYKATSGLRQRTRTETIELNLDPLRASLKLGAA